MKSYTVIVPAATMHGDASIWEFALTVALVVVALVAFCAVLTFALRLPYRRTHSVRTGRRRVHPSMGRPMPGRAPVVR